MIAAAVLALLAAHAATSGKAASASTEGPKATGSPTAKSATVSMRQFRRLQRQIRRLRQRLNRLARQPGPPGPQGPAGTAPACQGNQGTNPPDVMVSAGAVCIDRYEASIWDSPTGGAQITGAIPCATNGQNCTNIYARSVAGVTPRASITWFQAQQALANVGKRLPSNAEWQQAVAGTPDSALCRVGGGSVVATGSMAACISHHGANDMVGNLIEWVGDWDEEQAGVACDFWPAEFGNDRTCLGRGSGEASTRFPGALVRGGTFSGGTSAGPFAVFGADRPSSSFSTFGFRGAR